MLFGRVHLLGLAIGWASAFAFCPNANAAETVEPAAPAPKAAKSVEEVANQKGFLYYPAAPPAGRMRFSLGATYDAIDPAVMDGMSIRVQQLAIDVQDSLGMVFVL